MKIYRPQGKNKIENDWIPETSGVYFLWSKYELLYIGKSKNLKKRIAQHFSNGFLAQHMVNPDEIWRVSIILTKDEFDALRLESNLIKLIPTKWNGSPFYKMDWYQDWKWGGGIFTDKNEFKDFKKEQPLEEQTTKLKS